MNSASEPTNPLQMVKKHVRLSNRSVVMPELGVGHDEQETDAKKRSSTNLGSELTNPLEMVKKNQAFESLNSDVRARS